MITPDNAKPEDMIDPTFMLTPGIDNQYTLSACVYCRSWKKVAADDKKIAAAKAGNKIGIPPGMNAFLESILSIIRMSGL